jgi:hypothetical protein
VSVGSSVIAADLCPSIVCTTFTSAPDAIARLAAVKYQDIPDSSVLVDSECVSLTVGGWRFSF